MTEMITLPDKQGRYIHDQDKIIESIEVFYTELYDSEHSTTNHTYPKEAPEITSWELVAALRDMKNGTTTGNEHNKHRYVESRRRHHQGFYSFTAIISLIPS